MLLFAWASPKWRRIESGERHTHLLGNGRIRHARERDVAVVDDIARGVRDLGADLLEFLALVVGAVPQHHLVPGIDQILDDAGAHDAQAEEAEALRRRLDVLRFERLRFGVHVDLLRLGPVHQLGPVQQLIDDDIPSRRGREAEVVVAVKVAFAKRVSAALGRRQAHVVAHRFAVVFGCDCTWFRRFVLWLWLLGWRKVVKSKIER